MHKLDRLYMRSIAHKVHLVFFFQCLITVTLNLLLLNIIIAFTICLMIISIIAYIFTITHNFLLLKNIFDEPVRL